MQSGKALEFKATRALLNHARSRVTLEHVRRYAPSDPGYPGYVAAFEAILLEGEGAISETFDVTEAIGLTRWGTARERDYRWFRILTSAVDILLGNVSERSPQHYSLCALLVDFFALEDEGDSDLPTHLLPGVCCEAGASEVDPKERPFCVLAEILVLHYDPDEEATIESLCQSLEESHQRFGEYFLPNTFEQNPNFTHSEEFLWGLGVWDQLHPVWLDLITHRFPTDLPVAREMKQRLLQEGARWMARRRVIS